MRWGQLLKVLLFELQLFKTVLGFAQLLEINFEQLSFLAKKETTIQTATA
jgi:hypothetical protein